MEDEHPISQMMEKIQTTAKVEGRGHDFFHQKIDKYKTLLLSWPFQLLACTNGPTSARGVGRVGGG